jgi:hypothetical protein
MHPPDHLGRENGVAVTLVAADHPETTLIAADGAISAVIQCPK